jgi:hypothetical protein
MSVMEPPLTTLTTGKGIVPSHQYHADAHALSGYLHHPVYQRISEKAAVAIKDYRDDHIQEEDNRYNLEGFVSFQSAHSRVSGSRSLKKTTAGGWITLSTSVVEKLNVFEVITADRVVSQVSTNHAYINGHVPSVTFLGTQFVNLRLSGYPLEPVFNFGVCGTKPKGMTPYAKDADFLEGVKRQVETVADGDLPLDVRDRYIKRLKTVNGLLTEIKEGRNGRESCEPIVVTCSLIESIDIHEIRIPGLRAAGNVLFIPDFGTVALGEIQVKCSLQHDGEYDNYFRLQMMEMNLGCIGNGNLVVASGANNGTHHP